MDRHQHKTSFFGRFATSVILFAVTCAGCIEAQRNAPTHYVRRMDTTQFGYWHMDSTTIRTIHEYLLAAFPHEAAFCLIGKTEVRPDSNYGIDVVGFKPAEGVDSTSESMVWFKNYETCAGVPHAVGIGHDHPYAVNRACEHSPADAIRLFMDREMIFSLVFCGSGEAEVLWQDGRRYLFVWAKPLTTSGLFFLPDAGKAPSRTGSQD